MSNIYNNIEDYKDEKDYMEDIYRNSIYNEYKKTNTINLNKLGDYINSDKMEYVLYLYISYCSKVGINPYEAIELIVEGNVSNPNVLFNADKYFKSWVLDQYRNKKDYYINHLKNLGLNLESNNIIELYKGKLDSVKNDSSSISPYATTMNQRKSLLAKHDGSLVKEYAKSIEEIDDKKIYLIQNPYSYTNLIYLLTTLSNTDNEVIISFWGNEKDRNREEAITMISKILDYFEINNSKLERKEEIINGMYVNSFIINTKDLKKEEGIELLLSEKEKTFLKNSKYKEKENTKIK